MPLPGSTLGEPGIHAQRRSIGAVGPQQVDSHLREKRFVESILPVTHWNVETAAFDIHKITNPDVSGTGYQQGPQKDFYNVKAYVLHRDKYRCRSGRKGKHSKKLHVHHIVFRSQGGSNAPGNLVTLCETCHEALHAGAFQYKAKKSRTKHATEIGIIKSDLARQWDFKASFGYETKFKREQVLRLPKTHYFDAVAVCCEDGEWVKPAPNVFYKRHVASGDYQQTKGRHSGKRLPVGKLFGLRKHDLVRTPQGTGFVKGKRSSGYFALETLRGKTVHASANVQQNTVRLAARSTTLIQMEAAILPGTEVPGFLAEDR
jgi:5-methylcytosine-specific restriction endonuclease McrA